MKRDFRLQVFYTNQFPKTHEFPNGAMSNFFEIRRDIRNFVFIAGVNGTGVRRYIIVIVIGA